jgi:3-hydroxyisobutyrate dehydrogenase
MGEAFAWIERTGLDRAQALAFLSDGAVGSPVTKTVAARMAAPDFTPNFFLKLMAKDLGYAVGEAARAGQKLTTAATALQRFQAAIAAGHGEQDMAAVVHAARADR